jgi:hypothetical protein
MFLGGQDGWRRRALAWCTSAILEEDTWDSNRFADTYNLLLVWVR